MDAWKRVPVTEDMKEAMNRTDLRAYQKGNKKKFVAILVSNSKEEGHHISISIRGLRSFNWPDSGVTKEVILRPPNKNEIKEVIQKFWPVDISYKVSQGLSDKMFIHIWNSTKL